MKISFSWLREYLRTDKTAAEIATILTNAGLEVGSIESTGVAIPKVVAAQVLESIQHPNADRLSVCKVDDGSGTLRQIVCGAKNYKVGDKVPLALPGAVMPGDFKIKVGKLRGIESEGMMCSSKELGLGEGAQGDVGLLILPPDTIVGTPLTELFPAEEVFEIEITPNRPDWLSHRRVAIEAVAFGAGELINSQRIKMVPKVEDSAIAVIADTKAASFYSIRRIEGVKVGPSPEWLRKRLESVGLRSINNVVDVTNFVMLDLGQPLHAFDAAKIQGALTVRFAKEREKFLALDGKEYTLTSKDIVIADNKAVQALAGIIGSAASCISETTTTILLEGAVFDSSMIRSSSRKHKISTDSSYRFERGANNRNALYSSAFATALILDAGGGEADEQVVTVGSPKFDPVHLRYEKVRSFLGVDIDDSTIDKYLEKLGMRKSPKAPESWKIHFLRNNDIKREVDLIEEVARLHGIENIPAKLQSIPAPSSEADRAYDFARGLRRRLSGMGFHEARSGTLTGSQNQAAYAGGEILSVRNPMGEEHSTLRGSLIPGLLDAVARNLRHGTGLIRLFEIGTVYQEAMPNELMKLGFVMTGRTAPADWRGEPGRTMDIFDLKGVISSLGGCTEEITFRAATHDALPLSLEIMLAGNPAGHLGILSPSAVREVSVGGHQGQVVVAELDLTVLQAVTGGGFAKDPKRFGTIPKFPAVRRDLALMLDAATPYSVVEQAALEAKEELLASVTPFDIFSDPEGVKVPPGKKSLAIALTFQHADRTLTAEEVAEALGRIVTRLRETAGAEVRS